MSNEITDKIINIQTREVLDMEVVDTLKDNAMLKVKPELWKTLDFKKNNELDVDIYKLTFGSGTELWWLCTKCKSSYKCTVNDRKNGRGCSYCHGLKVNHTNSLASLYPETAKEWHPTKNGDLTPENITYGSDRKAWWICSKCHSDYDAVINGRTKNNAGCSYCAGRKVNHTNSLSTLNPTLASQWHLTKNGELTSHDVTCGSHKKVWWLGKCGHEWSTAVKTRALLGVGCPYCDNKRVLIGINDMWTTNPELAKCLLNPDDGYKHTKVSGRMVDWRCPNCTNVINNRQIGNFYAQGVKCPMCSDGISYPEKFMSGLLSQLSIEHFKQKTFNWLDDKIYDFYLEHISKTIIIEMHGIQHYIEAGFSSMGGRSLKEEQENDRYKYSTAMSNGIDSYIVIDARYSELDWIKNSILSSELAEIFNLEEINWLKIDENAKHSMHIKILNLWNSEFNLKDISKETDYSESGIRQILRKFAKIGLCSYGYLKDK